MWSCEGHVINVTIVSCLVDLVIVAVGIKRIWFVMWPCKTAWSKGLLTMQGDSSLYVTTLVDLGHFDCGDTFFIYNVITCVQRVAWLYEWKLLTVSYHLTKFGDNKLCGSGEIMDLVFHVNLQNHAIKGPFGIMEGSSSLYNPTLPSSVAISIVVVDV